jgi:hypothetical protein
MIGMKKAKFFKELKLIVRQDIGVVTEITRNVIVLKEKTLCAYDFDCYSKLGILTL